MITKLSIGNVRSLDGLEYEFCPGINVICGPNGSGKTTVLESAFVLAQGFSFRAKDLKEMVRWNCEELVMRATFEFGGRKTVRALGLSLPYAGAARCKVSAKQDGEAVRSPASFFGTCPAVIMQPSDIELLRGSPEVRRHWLDEILCFRSAASAENLRRYKRILQQRNQWLRQFKKDGSAVGGEDLFRALTEQLVDVGSRLWVDRVSLAADISTLITGYYRKLSGGVDEITCDYRSSILETLDALDIAEPMDGDVPPESSAEPAVPDESVFRTAFAHKLASLDVAERAMGMTLAGPHRDDLDLCASGYGMRSVGSQGQCRSAAIAMRFAAVDVAREHVGKPILLLDDVFAELDVNRRDAVASLIREKDCQVLIATPQSEELPFVADAVIELRT